jgi:hypothetical protein
MLTNRANAVLPNAEYQSMQNARRPALKQGKRRKRKKKGGEEQKQTVQIN